MYRYLTYAVVVSLSFAAAWFCKPSPPLEFASVMEAKHRLEKAGFLCTSFYESVAPVVVVTEKEISSDAAFEFQSSHVAANSSGKILLMKVKGDYDVRPQNWRTWGKVSATGDPALLDRIESIMKSE